jgi:hypothetical protein
MVKSVVILIQQQLVGIHQQLQQERETSQSLVTWISSLDSKLNQLQTTQHEQYHDQKKELCDLSMTCKDWRRDYDKERVNWNDRMARIQQDIAHQMQRVGNTEQRTEQHENRLTVMENDFCQVRKYMSSSLRTQDSNLKKLGTMLHRQQEDVVGNEQREIQQVQRRLQGQLNDTVDYTMSMLVKQQKEQAQALAQLTRQLETRDDFLARSTQQGQHAIERQMDVWRQSVARQFEEQQQKWIMIEQQWGSALKGLRESVTLIRECLERERRARPVDLEELKESLTRDVEEKMEELRRELRRSRPIVVI